MNEFEKLTAATAEMATAIRIAMEASSALQDEMLAAIRDLRARVGKLEKKC